MLSEKTILWGTVIGVIAFVVVLCLYKAFEPMPDAPDIAYEISNVGAESIGNDLGVISGVRGIDIVETTITTEIYRYFTAVIITHRNNGYVPVVASVSIDLDQYSLEYLGDLFGNVAHGGTRQRIAVCDYMHDDDNGHDCVIYSNDDLTQGRIDKTGLFLAHIGYSSDYVEYSG